jgi:hypothetical protein
MAAPVVDRRGLIYRAFGYSCQGIGGNSFRYRHCPRDAGHRQPMGQERSFCVLQNRPLPFRFGGTEPVQSLHSSAGGDAEFRLDVAFADGVEAVVEVGDDAGVVGEDADALADAEGVSGFDAGDTVLF